MRAVVTFVPLVLVASLAGCASAPNVLSGNAAGVIVSHSDDAPRMLAVANGYCANYGKIARFNAAVDKEKASFDCVDSH